MSSSTSSPTVALIKYIRRALLVGSATIPYGVEEWRCRQNPLRQIRENGRALRSCSRYRGGGAENVLRRYRRNDQDEAAAHERLGDGARQRRRTRRRVNSTVAQAEHNRTERRHDQDLSLYDPSAGAEPPALRSDPLSLDEGDVRDDIVPSLREGASSTISGHIEPSSSVTPEDSMDERTKVRVIYWNRGRPHLASVRWDQNRSNNNIEALSSLPPPSLDPTRLRKFNKLIEVMALCRTVIADSKIRRVALRDKDFARRGSTVSSQMFELGTSEYKTVELMNNRLASADREGRPLEVIELFSQRSDLFPKDSFGYRLLLSALRQTLPIYNLAERPDLLSFLKRLGDRACHILSDLSILLLRGELGERRNHLRVEQLQAVSRAVGYLGRNLPIQFYTYRASYFINNREPRRALRELTNITAQTIDESCSQGPLDTGRAIRICLTLQLRIYLALHDMDGLTSALEQILANPSLEIDRTLLLKLFNVERRLKVRCKILVTQHRRERSLAEQGVPDPRRGQEEVEEDDIPSWLERRGPFLDEVREPTALQPAASQNDR